MNDYFETQIKNSKPITIENAGRLASKDAADHIGEHLVFYILESETKNGLIHVEVLRLYTTQIEDFIKTHTFLRCAGSYENPLPIFKIKTND